MQTKYARTGLKMELRLYQAAQRRAGGVNQSFAAYVIDLIACDLAQSEPKKSEIPDVNRVRGLVKTKNKRALPLSVESGKDSTKSDWTGNVDGPAGRDDKRPRKAG